MLRAARKKGAQPSLKLPKQRHARTWMSRELSGRARAKRFFNLLTGWSRSSSSQLVVDNYLTHKAATNGNARRRLPFMLMSGEPPRTTTELDRRKTSLALLLRPR